jgi:hypothetical protein
MGSNFRENSLFPGESTNFFGKQRYFPENSIDFPGKRSVASGNYPIPIGNWFISRRTVPFFREIELFPGEQYRFSGKTVQCRLAIIQFPLENGQFSGEQYPFPKFLNRFQATLVFCFLLMVHYPLPIACCFYKFYLYKLN